MCLACPVTFVWQVWSVYSKVYISKTVYIASARCWLEPGELQRVPALSLSHSNNAPIFLLSLSRCSPNEWTMRRSNCPRSTVSGPKVLLSLWVATLMRPLHHRWFAVIATYQLLPLWHRISSAEYGPQIAYMTSCIKASGSDPSTGFWTPLWVPDLQFNL